MKTFIEHISEDSPAANVVGDGKNIAGVMGDPIKKKGTVLTKRTTKQTDILNVVE